MPRSLDLDRLKRFEPATSVQPDAGPSVEPAGAGGPVVERWPSREPARDGQISIKAPLDVIARFKKICKDDRRTYADMLHILMDLYESRK